MEPLGPSFRCGAGQAGPAGVADQPARAMEGMGSPSRTKPMPVLLTRNAPPSSSSTWTDVGSPFGPSLNAISVTRDPLAYEQGRKLFQRSDREPPPSRPQAPADPNAMGGAGVDASEEERDVRPFHSEDGGIELFEPDERWGVGKPTASPLVPNRKDIDDGRSCDQARLALVVLEEAARVVEPTTIEPRERRSGFKRLGGLGGCRCGVHGRLLCRWRVQHA